MRKKSNTKTVVKKTAKSPTISNRTVRKQLSETRRDIRDWRLALQQATKSQDPRNWRLQQLFSDIANDNILTSQLNNRLETIISSNFELIDSESNIDEKATAELNVISMVVQDIISAIFESRFYGYSLIELSVEKDIKRIFNINRENVTPINGRFYPDYSQNSYINYRELKEFGSWILEFNNEDLGLLNKMVPNILFKKFAKSGWSEFCEIFGIPPRYLKTDTTDPVMLDKAEKMMEQSGRAMWIIIDTNEEFEFASSTSPSNGDIYSKLIKCCDNEISLLVSGAVIGQDTQHGTQGKEKVSMELLDRLINSDKRIIENYFNTTVIPALINIAWISPTESKFRFAASEDTDKLWAYVRDLLPHKEIDNEWIMQKFGIPVSDKTFGTEDENLSNENGFFV